MSECKSAEAICVGVFARVGATVTHEIKNVLSVINENAGLLDDLAEMAGEDAVVPAPRVKAAAQAVMSQVGRANVIMKDLNSFSHSGDDISVKTAVGEVLRLAVALTARQAAMKKQKVELLHGEKIELTTVPLVLISLFCRCLWRIYSEIPEGAELVIMADRTSTGCAVSFMLKDDAGWQCTFEPDHDDLCLADCIQAELHTETGKITLSLGEGRT